MSAQVPDLGWGARQSSADTSRSDLVETKIAQRPGAELTLYGCGAPRCGVAGLVISIGRTPSEIVGYSYNASR